MYIWLKIMRKGTIDYLWKKIYHCPSIKIIDLTISLNESYLDQSIITMQFLSYVNNQHKLIYFINQLIL